ncbi:MAG TPA: PEP-CTERM sorting domain-containing protein [Rhodocyclaceae bacterium]|nr:PEP-CTERM sorting domain-containing protein [Rhodocyclaceae bacterium]
MKRYALPLALVCCLFSSVAGAKSSLTEVVSASGLHTTSFGSTDSFSATYPAFAGIADLSFDFGTLDVVGGKGTVTYTYLGSGAGYGNNFEVDGATVFSNHGATIVGATFSAGVSTGLLDFGFLTPSPTSYSSHSSYLVTDATVVGDLATTAACPGANCRQGVFGIVADPRLAKGSYQYLLIYNDPVTSGDHDYNDMVVGVNFTPAVPEPGSYAMIVAGLGLLSAVCRRGLSR